MMNSPEFYLWGILPMAIGLFILIKTIQKTFRKKTFLNWLFTFLIVIPLLFAELVLYSIFFNGAYPTYIPYYIIGYSIIVFGIQTFVQKKDSII